MSVFGGLETARKGLIVSQKAIEVTGHNIANANTIGYSRQRLNIQSVEPASAVSRYALSSVELIGQGARIASVEQIRNSFLDNQFRKETSLGSSWGTRSEGLGYVELLFDELHGTGLSAAINQFSGSLQELTKSPATNENRTNVLQNAISLAETLQHFSTQLSDKQGELDQTVQVMTGQINTIAQSIAALNSQIGQYELSGQQANDLRDQRNSQLDDLSKLIDFTTAEDSKGQLQVFLGDQKLVDYITVRNLTNELTVDNPLNGETDALSSVIWEDNSTAVSINSGSLQATLDLRDGATADNVGVPYFSLELDRLTVGLANAFNEVHEAGWTLPNAAAGTTSVTGIPFFTTELDTLGVAKPMSASSIRVNPAIETNLSLIAASDAQVTSDSITGNNKNALSMVALFSSEEIPDLGSFSGFINGFIGTVAAEANQANNRAENQNVLTDSIDKQRASIMGVSLDEETTNLIKFQHSYAAAARVITTIDEMLDVLINRTGIVGR